MADGGVTLVKRGGGRWRPNLATAPGVRCGNGHLVKGGVGAVTEAALWNFAEVGEAVLLGRRLCTLPAPAASPSVGCTARRVAGVGLDDRARSAHVLSQTANVAAVAVALPWHSCGVRGCVPPLWPRWRALSRPPAVRLGSAVQAGSGPSWRRGGRRRSGRGLPRARRAQFAPWQGREGG